MFSRFLIKRVRVILDKTDQQRSAEHLIISGSKEFRMGKECPRCGREVMKEPIELNSITNEDKKTYICSNCGVNENKMLWMRTKNMHKQIPKEQKELQKKFREKLGLD